MQERSAWSSNIGFLLAAIGSAIGLGNVWRFSYMAYSNGGGAFLIPYLIALVVAGIPIILVEYGIGHKEKGSSALSFFRISSKTEFIGWMMPIFAIFGIQLYYSVVIGWCVNFVFYSFNLTWGSDPQGFFFNTFLQLSADPFDISGVRWPILGATFLIWIVIWFICYKDVSHGIEKFSKIFMPVLFVLTSILVFWSISLDGAFDAIKNFYLKPDFGKINVFASEPELRKAALKIWGDAFSQIFFTLSLGFGVMIAYSSYLPKKVKLVRNGLVTAGVNSFYSLFTGLAVFGVLGYMSKTQNLPFDKVIKGGPQLAFVVYPKAISSLPAFRELFGFLFFIALVLAGITSAISLVEAFASALNDKFNYKRENIVTSICVFGFLGSSIYATHSGLYILDIVDYFVTHFGLVLGGICELLIVGYILKPAVLRNHINDHGSRLSKMWDLSVKYISPAILLIIFGIDIFQTIVNGYGGYSPYSLLLFGLLPFCVLLIISVVLSFSKWPKEKLKHIHQPEEDELLV